MAEKKQYGLILPKKSNQGLVKKLAVFGGESDSEDSDGGKDWVRKSLKAAATQSTLKKQTKIDLKKAEEEDATVFQYDEVYDQMDKEREEKASLLKGKDKKPKYIQQLLKNAEKRKVENERRIERQVQKEREEEGDEFADKEVFVTSAYKKKLEEFAQLDAEQKRQDMLEQIGDVTKQADISGFYRHLYETTVADPSERKPVKVPLMGIKEEPKSDEEEEGKEENDKEETEEKEPEGKKEKKGKRQYRKRKGSESPTENPDADTDVEMSSSESEDEAKGEESEAPKAKRHKESVEEVKDTNEVVIKQEKEEEVVKIEPVEVKEEKVKVPERSVWEKRTVGEVFDAALQRYYERKNARMERGC